MRTVFLGTSEFAAAVLRTLAGSTHRPALVLTRPDRPRGRGRKLASPPVADAARELELILEQPATINAPAAHELIAAAAPERLVVCAFGALIKEPLLSDYELLNVHPSLLPRWRGAAPVERAMMAGDERTGVSIMRLTAGLDTGPVCLQESLRIAPEENYGSLAERLAQCSGRLLLRALEESPRFVEQSQEGVSYAEKIGAEDRQLDAARPADELARTVRALTPQIGAWIALDGGERLGVRRATALAESELEPGTLSLDGSLPRVGCTPGTLELREVQPAGKRPMSGEDFLRGYRR